jgi:serine protein kinase
MEKTSPSSEFETIIQKDRDSRKAMAWRGTFLGYLEQVKEDPLLPKLAHARIHNIVMALDGRRENRAPVQG